jgi:hypothetical protein
MLTNDRSLRIAIWIIALSLAVIALRPIVEIKDVQAQSQLSGSAESGRIVPFASQGAGVFWAYDRQTLAIYVYDTRDGQCYFLGKLSQLGKPMNQSGVQTVPFLR